MSASVSPGHDGKKHYAHVRIEDRKGYSFRAQKPRGEPTTITVTGETPADLLEAVKLFHDQWGMMLADVEIYCEGGDV